jgi:hypothetical protein
MEVQNIGIHSFTCLECKYYNDQMGGVLRSNIKDIPEVFIAVRKIQNIPYMY